MSLSMQPLLYIAKRKKTLIIDRRLPFMLYMFQVLHITHARGITQLGWVDALFRPQCAVCSASFEP